MFKRLGAQDGQYSFWDSKVLYDMTDTQSSPREGLNGGLSPREAATVSKEAQTYVCYWCEGDHPLQYCPDLLSEANIDRLEKELEVAPISTLDKVRPFVFANDRSAGNQR